MRGKGREARTWFKAWRASSPDLQPIPQTGDLPPDGSESRQNGSDLPSDLSTGILACMHIHVGFLIPHSNEERFQRLAREGADQVGGGDRPLGQHTVEASRNQLGGRTRRIQPDHHTTVGTRGAQMNVRLGDVLDIRHVQAKGQFGTIPVQLKKRTSSGSGLDGVNLLTSGRFDHEPSAEGRVGEMGAGQHGETGQRFSGSLRRRRGGDPIPGPL